MSLLAEIEPRFRNRVMDLVEQAGVDVEDWKNFRGGAAKAASNPKYCYDWSFVEPGKVVVLNLWHANLIEKDGKVFRNFKADEFAKRLVQRGRTTVWQRRIDAMAEAIRTAVRDNLPVRVIVCEGDMRQIQNEGSKASTVNNRILDPLPWAVTAYDLRTGECTVTRGGVSDVFVDQFSVAELPGAVARRAVSGETFVRSADVRRKALVRAAGRCEWCKSPGFLMEGGRIYLETHHVVPLSEGGADNDVNVVALCANHHREAHYGARRDLLLQGFEASRKERASRR